MYTLRDLEFITFKPVKGGFNVSASYPGWNHRFDFFVRFGGSVEGRTSSGRWQELSEESSSIIRAKVKNILAQEPEN